MKRWSGFGSELGRSMIEMLGVLAIVGVLSVGGISGFQKAMNKHKINQVTEELSGFINELLRYSKDWRQMLLLAEDGNRPFLASEVDFILPGKWKREGYFIYDSMGNKFYVQLRKDVSSSPKSIALSYRFNERDDKIKIDLCMAYYDMLKPYADSISEVWIWGRNDQGQHTVRFYGNAYCGRGKKCLSDLTLNEMRDNCNAYKADDEDSSFFIAFPL